MSSSDTDLEGKSLSELKKRKEKLEARRKGRGGYEDQGRPTCDGGWLHEMGR